MALPNLQATSNPFEDMIAEEETADHARAQRRGLRVLGLADSIASKLQANGMLRTSPQEASAEIFHAIADDLYGNAAVDVPTLRGRS